MAEARRGRIEKIEKLIKNSKFLTKCDEIERNREKDLLNAHNRIFFLCFKL